MKQQLQQMGMPVTQRSTQELYEMYYPEIIGSTYYPAPAQYSQTWYGATPPPTPPEWDYPPAPLFANLPWFASQRIG